MDREITVYCITHLASGRRYVGITKNLEKRMAVHKHAGGGCRRLHRAIRKYGWCSFSITPLVRSSREESNRIERGLIARWGLQYERGFNLEPGGESHDHHPETRAKISAALTGKKRASPSAETLARRSVALKESWVRRKARGDKSPMTGRKHSAETKAKMSATQKQVVKTPSKISPMGSRVLARCRGRVSGVALARMFSVDRRTIFLYWKMQREA